MLTWLIPGSLPSICHLPTRKPDGSGEQRSHLDQESGEYKEHCPQQTADKSETDQDLTSGHCLLEPDDHLSNRF
jgi:hypothetical protein